MTEVLQVVCLAQCLAPGEARALSLVFPDSGVCGTLQVGGVPPENRAE